MSTNNPVSLHPRSLPALAMAEERGIDHLRKYFVGHGVKHLWDSFYSLQVGSLVHIPRSSYTGVGVVYEVYRSGDWRSVSIIMEDGRYDGWNLTDWALVDGELVGECWLEYQFENSAKLIRDYSLGMFDVGFQRARAMAG